MNKGIFYGICAYLMWGFFPIYFKSLQEVSALEIVLHRMAWSFVFVSLLLAVRGEWKRFMAAVSQRRVLVVYSAAGVLLGINWLTFVWAVNAGFVVESSLGYFINPLVSLALGVIFLREKLRLLQWLPVGLAALGVLYLTLQYGRPPWIALALASSFGFYGLLTKTSPLGSLQGLALETGLLFLPAAAVMVFLGFQGRSAFLHAGAGTTVLLSMAGVISATPLLFFGRMTQSVPLWLVGILQYITPTGHFLLGVLVYDEPFTFTQLIGFAVIWTALLIFTLEGALVHRHRARVQPIGNSLS